MDEDVLCPVCGAVCDTIYFSEEDGEIVGCDCCISTKDAYEWLEERKADAETEYWDDRLDEEMGK